jgi:Mrp family chromosome partitioning ATPase/capsular polysaccharide biosynthesis protein
MKRHRPLVALIVLLVVGAGVYYAASRPKTALATTSIVVEDPQVNNPLNVGATGSGNYVADQVDILKLPTVAEHASALVARTRPDIHLTTQDFQASRSVTRSTNSDLITVSFRDADPRVAQVGANAVIDAYNQVLKENASANSAEELKTLGNQIATVQTQINTSNDRDPNSPAHSELQTLQNRQLAVENLGNVSGIIARSPARLPGLSAHGVVKIGILALVVSLIPAAGVSYLLDVRRRRFSNRSEPELVLDAPLVSEIPHFGTERLESDLPSLDQPGSGAAEAFRFASSSLAIRPGWSETVVVVVTSASSSDGKTTVAANLAVTAAKEGRRVLAIDGDLSGQGMAWILLGDATRGLGLIEVANGTAPLRDALVKAPVGEGVSVDVLRGGHAYQAPSELFLSPGSRALFENLRQQYDLVVIDAPSVLHVAYAASLTVVADATLVVVPHNSGVKVVEDLAERLNFLKAEISGYIYNRAPLRRELGLLSRTVTDERRRPVTTADGESRVIQIL